MDSAIGLSTMIAVGPENFRSAPLNRNLSALMGLLAVDPAPPLPSDLERALSR